MPGILVGVDGSHGSPQVLKWALRQAALEHAPVTVLTVHPVIKSAWTGGPVVTELDKAEERKALQAAEEATEKAVQELDAGLGKVEVTVRAISGWPAHALIEASRDADLVVVGSRGGGGFAGLLTGSVTTQVVNHATCAVVVVRH